jgi:hypothetical protein
MEMTVVAPDEMSATALAERLALAFGSDRILLREGHRAVEVWLDPEPDPIIVRVVDTVERWCDQARVATVELWLGERSYRIARWVSADSWTR